MDGWLEDVFPIEIVPFFGGRIRSFSGELLAGAWKESPQELRKYLSKVLFAKKVHRGASSYPPRFPRKSWKTASIVFLSVKPPTWDLLLIFCVVPSPCFFLVKEFAAFSPPGS